MVRFICITMRHSNSYPAVTGKRHQFHPGQYAEIREPEDILYFDENPRFERHPKDKKIKVKLPKPEVEIKEFSVDNYLDQNWRTTIKSIREDNPDEDSLKKLLEAEGKGKKRKGVIKFLKKMLK